MKNKPRKAVYCRHCKNFKLSKDNIGMPLGDPCKLNHKPRFYMPETDTMFSDYGWKRRCEDFKGG